MRILISNILIMVLLAGCSVIPKSEQSDQASEIITTRAADSGIELYIQVTPGKYHNHPTFAVWLEDMNGNFIRTLYVTQYLSDGIWNHGELEPGKWMAGPGEAVRPASLPYWLHKRGKNDLPKIPTPDDPVPDALTSATPGADFILSTKTGMDNTQNFQVIMEVNQPWDWNDYWHNNKYPEDEDYKTSCQPAVIYAVTIDPNNIDEPYYMNPIGHSHHSGQNGRLYTNLSTLTTALEIIDQIKIYIKQ